MKKLFSSNPFAIDFSLLILRLFPALFMLFAHGLGKLTGYQERAQTFADPFGIGSEASLILVIFAEFFCSILIVLGLATRLATIPLIITMLVAVFIQHANDPFARQELGLLYLIIFISVLFLGPGRFSIDQLISGRDRFGNKM
jgi:putative oxidoreductase